MACATAFLIENYGERARRLKSGLFNRVDMNNFKYNLKEEAIRDMGRKEIRKG